MLANEDFRTLFLLLVSLLHGNLFIALTERTLVISEQGLTLALATTIVLNYAVFFRVLQSQLAAAMKYDAAWRVNPFDYLLVFITAIFEYTLFTHDRFSWASEEIRLWLIVGFAIFGAISYALTYLRTRRSLTGDERRDERTIQLLNIVFMVASAIVGTLALLCVNSHFLPYVNLFLSLLLVLNIYTSLTLTLRLVHNHRVVTHRHASA